MKKTEVVGEVEYIHPYGRGFLIYSDKQWQRGILKLRDEEIEITGIEQLIIPVKFVTSIDKSITLPVLREGRALILVEYINIQRRETIYLLISAEERFIKKLRLAILICITSKIKITYSVKESWISGLIGVEDFNIVLRGPKPIKIAVKDIIDVKRTTMKFGLNKVGIIVITYLDSGEKNQLNIFVQPIKRIFFWQLIQQVVDDYLNTEVVNKLTNLEKNILHLINKEWRYDDIMRKLEIDSGAMEKIIEKLVRLGLIRKIIVLQVTERGKKMLNYFTEEFSQ